VATEDKHSVTADAVVVATNSPISDYVVTHAKMAPYRTFVIGARVPRGSAPTILLWDTPDPYHYVRVQPLGDHDVLIVGGEDHKTGQADDADARFRRLEEWTRERFPAVQSIDYRWSGQVMEPSDHLGFIGPNPDGAPNVYLVTGDSGNGMTNGAVAGMLLRDLILGRPNPWAGLYDPKRVSLRAAGDLAKENLNVAAQYIKDYVSPGEVGSVDDIPPGTGKVIRRGIHKIAAYRDPEGKLLERSAVCTHLKCIVDWNSAEKSWDCPCHGSRFAPDGSVLNGPALEPLGKVE
jgi:nitrite reductase/ring-hydroxylating ferredoxin subunit